MRFLIVDDASEPLQYLRQLLASLGHQVVGEARDGQTAVEAFVQLRPDAVLMDVIMPRMNGLEALDAIRHIDPAATVVLFSSMRSPATALESERRGARFFLNKPFDQHLLETVVRRLASGRA
jgi:two-component system chemotaxis response regulator CheY